ncbi:hypothetical protein FG877_04265 [Enterococcus casseliflavus]|uniref:thiopeptide-type bacteriocin biosynthesis protein n=1 Tax=unclassified Enterococcus TaxID=2608891 RepID=UPI001C702622|nr:hypothetical protein [Enterococcus casseliflavus]
MNKFKILDEFHLRYNNLNTEVYYNNLEHLDGKGIIEWCIENFRLISESIFYANDEILNKIIYYSTLSEKEKKSVEETTFKYLSRYFFRPTPFGFFSTVKLGSFQNKNNEKFIKKTSIEISHLWLENLRRQLEVNNMIVKNLFVTSSPFISLYDGDLVLFDNYSSISDEQQTKIKKTPILEFILENTQKKKSVTELAYLVGKKFCINDLEKTILFIRKLISLKILVTDFFENIFYSVDKLNRIIDICDSKDMKVAEDLKKIRESITNLEGSNDYIYENLKKIISLQKKIIEAESYLYINQIDESYFFLDKKAKKEVQQAGNIIALLTEDSGTGGMLTDYIEFLGKIPDAEKETKLVDLLNKTFDLNKKKTNPDTTTFISDNISYQYLMSKIGFSLLTKSDVELNEDDINYIERYHDSKNSFDFVNEFELIFTIQKQEQEKVYIYNLQSMSAQIGGYFSRFEKNFKNSKIYKNEDYLYLDIADNFLPTKLFSRSPKQRTFDLVDSHKNFNNLEVIDFTLNSDKSININQLFIKLINNELFIIDDKSGKVLLPRQINLINIPMIYNRMYILLYFSRMQFYKAKADFLSLIIDNFYYIPRIRYKNIIILKRHWKLNYHFLKFHGENTDIKNFKMFLEKIKVPKMLKMASNDENTNYNIDNPYHLELLYRNLKKYGEITVTECDSAFGESLIENHSNQFVFSFINNTIHNSLPNIFERNRYDVHNNGLNLKWISYKIYFNERKQNDVIEEHLVHVFNYLSSIGMSNFFFIRYCDPDPHLRIRMQVTENHMIDVNEVQSEIRKIIHPIEIYDFCITSFYPEYHRYGGNLMTNDILDFFVNETNVLIKNPLAISLKSKNINNFLVAYIFNYLKNFFNSIDDIYSLLLPFKVNKSVHQKEISDCLGSIEEYEKKIISFKFNRENGGTLKKTFSVKKNQERNSIALSIIHMTINRYHDIDRENENRIMKLLFELARIKKFKNKE